MDTSLSQTFYTLIYDAVSAAIRDNAPAPVPASVPVTTAPPSAEPQTELPPIMSPNQLAVELDVTVRTLERWRADGEGPEYRNPAGTRFYRYYREDVLEWLNSGVRFMPL